MGIKNFFDKLPSWAKILISILIIYYYFQLLSSFYNKYIVILISVWFLIPFVVYIISIKYILDRISYKLAKLIIFLSLCLTISVSFALFANFYDIRDRIGDEYIAGYYSERTPDYDEYGRQTSSVDIKAKNWYDRVFLWAGEWFFIGLIFGIPYLTWKSSAIVVRTKKIKELEKYIR